jgi:hypothetical protein
MPISASGRSTTCPPTCARGQCGSRRSAQGLQTTRPSSARRGQGVGHLLDRAVDHQEARLAAARGVASASSGDSTSSAADQRAQQFGKIAAAAVDQQRIVLGVGAASCSIMPWTSGDASQRPSPSGIARSI